MEDTTQSLTLFKRSDGHYEDGKGNFALVMLAKTVTYRSDDRDINRLNFKPSFTAATISVDWPVDETVVLMPLEIVNGLTQKAYARIPTAYEIEQSAYELIDAPAGATVVVNKVDQDSDEFKAAVEAAVAAQMAAAAPTPTPAATAAPVPPASAPAAPLNPNPPAVPSKTPAKATKTPKPAKE